MVLCGHRCPEFITRCYRVNASTHGLCIQFNEYLMFCNVYILGYVEDTVFYFMVVQSTSKYDNSSSDMFRPKNQGFMPINRNPQKCFNQDHV